MGVLTIIVSDRVGPMFVLNVGPTHALCARKFPTIMNIVRNITINAVCAKVVSTRIVWKFVPFAKENYVLGYPEIYAEHIVMIVCEMEKRWLFVTNVWDPVNIVGKNIM